MSSYRNWPRCGGLILLALVLATAGCGSSGHDQEAVTVVQTVTTAAPAPSPSTTATPAPTGGSDATSHTASTDSSEAGFTLPAGATVSFTFQGFTYDMQMQTARLTVDGGEVETSAPHGYIWVVASFFVSNRETDRPVPSLGLLAAPEARVRRKFATRDDQKDDPVSTDNNNCKNGWCGVHTTNSGVVTDGEFEAVPCSTCEMAVGADTEIKAAYLVREGITGSDIHFYVPTLAPYGKDFRPASRRLA
jgi:hypothetical protein